MQTQPSDEEPWSDAVSADGHSFALLFERHGRAVYNHAFRLTGSWSLAEDVTQSTFLVAWRRRRDARTVDGSALPWLLVVATNTVRNEARSTRRWMALLRRAPVETAHTDPAEDVAGRVDDERRMAIVLDAVRRLPRAEREAVALCLWSGVSYRDAAVVLGISEASVRVRVSRARSRLSAMVPTQPQEA
jgi:RNA polymerase sigma-70 factor (ECF subfamily)